MSEQNEDRKLLERLAGLPAPGPENVSSECRGACGDIAALRDLAQKWIEAEEREAADVAPLSQYQNLTFRQYGRTLAQLATAQARVRELESALATSRHHMRELCDRITDTVGNIRYEVAIDAARQKETKGKL